jgi:RHS repeat-associated protein
LAITNLSRRPGWLRLKPLRYASGFETRLLSEKYENSSPGQFADIESGLNYNYARDYDPTTGRYVESDPIGLYGGVNTYQYAAADPRSSFDPLGLCWSNARTLAHFYGGGGNLTVGQIGCQSQIDTRVSPERNI